MLPPGGLEIKKDLQYKGAICVAKQQIGNNDVELIPTAG
jgi:hypothetical protein